MANATQLTTIKFQATVKDGVIEIPQEYQQDLAGVTSVEVIVLKPETASLEPKEDIIDFLTQNPIPIDEFPTREQMHDRQP